MAFRTREVIVMEWDNPGQAIEGRLLKVQSVKYSDGIGLRYLVRDESNGGKLIVFPGSARLNMLLQKDDIGKLIRVEYRGKDGSKEVRAGFSAPKLFDVAVDDDSTVQHGGPVDDGAPQITDDDLPF